MKVAVVGGGPAGSTVATLLRKYDPTAQVTVLERERFPRDHVGESQLPEISRILDEMEVWEKVEAAGFPIKIGATYRWGTTDDLWDFEFIPAGRFRDEPRPARFEGQRVETAFQVDRAVYDDILLRHAAEMGTDVREGTRVVEVLRDGGRVTGLRLADGEIVTADWYVDASGHVGILRRALGVQTDAPTSLQNIAIWDYWTDADWAVSIGVGGTRVQVMSLGYGWIWFIPISPTRTSVGLVVPAEYYKAAGKRPADLYRQALAEEPRIAALLASAESEDKLATTKDWSFLAERTAGENWFLAGESAGFADPILAAGMTLAHTGGRECAYTLLELERGEHNGVWLRKRYDEAQRTRIHQHIRFADYWYSTNAHFSDLKENCARIARDAGLELTPDRAFQWLGTGGFANDTVAGNAGIGTLSVESLKQVLQRLSGDEATWAVGRTNVWRLRVGDAERITVPELVDGRIHRQPGFRRVLSDGTPKTLPYIGLFALLIDVLMVHEYADDVLAELEGYFRLNPWLPTMRDNLRYTLHVLETMIADGWVEASYSSNRPLFREVTPGESACIHVNVDNRPVPGEPKVQGESFRV